MTFSTETANLLLALERHASGKMHHRDHLGVLIELAQRTGLQQSLDDLSFAAKFAHKCYGILKRIGPDAEGYEKLSKELSEAIGNCVNLINILLKEADATTKMKFTAMFLEKEPTAFQNLLSLLHDLSLLKNYSIDQRDEKEISNRPK